MQLSTPYALPYDVFYDDGPLMSTGQDIRVEVALDAPATAGVVDAIDSLILPFVLLATSGAMAGDKISPWASTIRDKQGPYAGDGKVEWVLQSCTVDDRSIAVLAQMLLSVHDSCAMARMTLSGGRRAAGVQRLADRWPMSNPYPGVYSDAGFPVVHLGDLGNEVLVRAVFDAPVSREVQVKMDAELFSWAAGLLTGAYGIAPIQPDECTASVEEKTILTKSELTWGLSRFRAHPAALDGLVNVFVSISNRLARVNQLVIE
jgi:hypothetical protein